MPTDSLSDILGRATSLKTKGNLVSQQLTELEGGPPRRNSGDIILATPGATKAELEKMLFKTRGQSWDRMSGSPSRVFSHSEPTETNPPTRYSRSYI
jgi:hypothetical protein